MSSFREQELGRKLLEDWKKDVPFSTMVEETGFRVQKIRTLIGEAAGGANEWRKMREARRSQRHGGAVIIKQENGLDLNLVRSVAQETVEGIFDSDVLREMVMDEVKKFPPQTGKLEVTIAKSDIKVTIKHSHQALKELLRTVGAGFSNTLLVGPAGSGKTTLAGQLSDCLKRGFGFLSLSGGTTEGQLIR
jgi:signal recognition particle GTPase